MYKQIRRCLLWFIKQFAIIFFATLFAIIIAIGYLSFFLWLGASN